MKAYIIIGRASVGKSSLVRGLTGIRNKDERLMAHQVLGPFKLWAQDSSLQEANILPSAFINDVLNRNVDAVLLTLWPNGKNSRESKYPDAWGYIQAFQNAGWQIEPLVILERGASITTNIPSRIASRIFQNRPQLPFNALMALVRHYWDWV